MFIATRKSHALDIFNAVPRNVKNLLVLSEGFNSTKNIFMSGVFEDNLMVKQGEITKENLDQINLRKIFKSRYEDMKGYKYQIGALPYSPFFMKNTEIYSGFEVLMLDTLATVRNFTYDIIEPADGQWGKVDKNGSWTGLVGHAMYGFTNLSMGLISITREREAVIDFSMPFYYDSIGFVAPLPKELP